MMMPHSPWQGEPDMHRLLKDRIGRRRKSTNLERSYGDPTDRRIAVTLPIDCAAAVGAEMETDAIPGVGPALVNLTFAVEPDALLQIRRAEMEGCAGSPLTCFAVADVNALGFPLGDQAKRFAMTRTSSFHVFPLSALRGSRSLGHGE